MSSHARDEQGHDLHFFKVILESNIRDGELRVPKGFVKRCWEEISNPVFMRLPNGFESKVHWIEKDGDVWFSNGWKEFAQYLSLEVSQFLVFRYEGKSRFHVIIFGKSALEIKYPLVTEDGVEELNDESDYSLRIVDDFERIKHKRPNSTNQSSQDHNKKMKTIPKEEEPECYYYSHTKTKHEKKKANDASFGNDDNSAGGSSDSDFENRIRAFHKKVNESFYSENHWFTRVMQKSYVERDLMIMQKKFAKTIMRMKEGGATLCLAKNSEKTWDVIIKRYSCDRQLAFASGWIKFVEDNNLKIGDVCVFVMNKCKGFSFNVVIFPFEDDSTLAYFAEQKRLCPSSCLKDTQTPKAHSGRAFFTNHFTIDIKDCYHVTIPMSFIRNYPILGEKLATLQVGKRTWNVKVRYYPASSYARFSDGWNVFIRECDLKEGDSCRMEMIDEENCLLNVSITKRIAPPT